MSLLEEWEGAVQTYGAGNSKEGLHSVETLEFAEAQSPRRAIDRALFSLQDVERQASRSVIYAIVLLINTGCGWE